MATLFTYAPSLRTVSQHILMMHLQKTRMKNILWSTVLFIFQEFIRQNHTTINWSAVIHAFKDSTTSSYIHDVDIHNFEMLMEEMCLYCLTALYHNQFLLHFPVY